MYLVTVCLHASNWGMSISAMIRQQGVRHQGATFISRITLKKRWWWFKLLIHQSCSLQSTCHGMKGSQITWQLHFSSKTFVLVVMLSWAKGCYTEIRGGFFFFFLSIYSGFLHPNKLSTRPLNTMNVSPCSTFNIPPSPPQMQLHLVSNHRIAAFKNTKVYSTQHSSSSNRALFVFNRSGKGQTTHYFILCWE